MSSPSAGRSGRVVAFAGQVVRISSTYKRRPQRVASPNLVQGRDVADLPRYEELADLDRGLIRGLIAARGAAATAADYEHAWERDRALLRAVEDALTAAVRGEPAEPAPVPRWVAGLVQRQLSSISRRSQSGEQFMRVRLLERLGLVELEPDDTYVLAMVSGIGPDRAAKLTADPELIERALWRVFEVEGGGEVSMTNVDRFGQDEWRKTFLALTAAGTLGRDRVLAGCLEALGRDFAAYRASWFSATYLALAPTLEELEHAQPALRRLLSASVPATVGFALKLLLRLQKVGRLDVAETVAALPPATLVKPKGAALDALKLARSAGADHGSGVVNVARSALGHPHPDVQRAAADLLEAHGAADSVTNAADELTPSVRYDLGLDQNDEHRVTAQPRKQLTAVPEPVTTSDVAERTAALLEDASDAGELEAVLAALVDRSMADHLSPLRKRAKAIVARGPMTDVGDSWLPGQVARLVLALLGEAQAGADPEVPALRFLARRFAEIHETDAPLLATPNLPGGWVSGQTLVERLAANPRPRHHDLVAALLRLHPDHRDDIDAIGLPPAVTFALSGVAPKRGLFKSARPGSDALWVAAERSRAPYGDHEAPAARGEIKTHRWNDYGKERQSTYARFTITTASRHELADDHPTELGRVSSEEYALGATGRFLADWIPSLAAIWPHDAEHFLAITCMSVLESPNWTAAAHDVPRVLDALACHPGRLGSLATLTLAAGLSASERSHRLHAVDAFVDLVPTGRIAERDLAQVMATYAAAWPLNRWAESLRSASDAPGGANAVVPLLIALLPQLPVGTRGLNGLLELLRDETIRQRSHLSDPDLLSWLRQHTGSSKTSTTARLLLG